MLNWTERGESLPPLIVLAGNENALSIVRSLASSPLRVVVITAGTNSVYRSRFEFERRPRPAGMAPHPHFAQELFGPRSATLRGGVLMPCGDEAIEFILAHRAQLEAEYVLDWHRPALQRAMLNKADTLDLAKKAGVPCPSYWAVDDMAAVRAAAARVEYPVLLKPVHSHLFQEHFNTKLSVARSEAELLRMAIAPLELGLQMMVTELIPGPDSLLSSYYTHLDAAGEPLFHFTKRVIRRNQVGFGSGCYHETKWLPETADLGLRFFKNMDFTGLGNVEFKRDPRDGQLKLIEVNARITAANQVLISAGLNLAEWIYRRLLGLPTPPADTQFRDAITLWYPMEDFDSFRELRGRGELSLGGWLRSVYRPQVCPFLRFDDPGPSLHRTRRLLGKRLKERSRRVLRRA